MGNLSSLLFAKPSWVEGASRLADIGGFLDDYNGRPSPADADRLALATDWLATSGDLRNAVRHFQVEVQPTLPLD